MGKKIRVIIGDLRNYQMTIWLFFLTLILFFIKMVNGTIHLGHFIGELFVTLFFWSLISRAVKNLYNSFWFFILLFFFYILTFFMDDLRLEQLTIQLGLIYFIIFTLIFIMINNLFTPIYYPLIKWWKFKSASIAVKVSRKNREFFRARLVDIRRGAGCLITFEPVGVGEDLHIQKSLDDFSEGVWVRVVTQRNYAFGRGYCLGVRFLFESEKSNKEMYQSLKGILA